MLGFCLKNHFHHNYKNEENCWRGPILGPSHSTGSGVGGNRRVGVQKHLVLAWASTIQMRVLKMTVPIACGLLRTLIIFTDIHTTILYKLFESISSCV